MNQPVCLILGAGAGIGGNVAKRFAREGYHACLARRSDQAGLDRLVSEIQAEGGSASGFLLNAVEENSIEELVNHIESSVGPITVAVFNLGAQIGDRGLVTTTLKQFEIGWRMATFGLFRLAKVLFPLMEARGKGSLLVTSATAAMRGIHVAHIIIDGAVDAPDTLGKMLGPERFQALREKKGLLNDGLLLPAEVANTYFYVAHQHRSAWTFELDLRAHSDLAWWNHAGNADLK
jgi:hypothetical protein